MSFKQQVRDFLATNRTVMSVQETQGAKDGVIAAYVAGAKSVAQLAIELGVLLEAASAALTPGQLMVARTLYSQIKEIVDHE